MDQYVTLNNGVKMPIHGVGVYQIPDDVTEQNVLDALDAGYRLIDTAAIYLNEGAVGRALKRTSVPRDEIFVVTKLWVESYRDAKQAFSDCLERLQLDYVDLILLHMPYSAYHHAWADLEDVYKEGKARAIGVSNFLPHHMADLIAFSKVVPAVNQVECHAFSQRNDVMKYQKEYGITTMAWAPFAEGNNNMFKNETLLSIGKKYGKTAAQVALRYQMQRGVIVIPKSVHKERLVENRDVFDFSLTEEDMAAIAELDLGHPMLVNHMDTEFIKLIATFTLASGENGE
ncbi:Aldo/keto reductase subgroup [Carpediemonas membranifera]|uniref:Aldo/keto reductase subgroup n=1 Tax=Carpediemonas membranifera TaxID=201153 RepID=A0A8J6EAU6_9EUKA|nr:Aldo/keto reductase subgroup [Carpediemonas membranifera]|eukprot:KAG9395410.1 Aldo/keto reductase subgroup [Carpediemonas membranifera]